MPKTKAAKKEYWREYYHENAARYRENSIKRRYGITSADYERMAAAQGGLCAICESKPERLHIDHEHTSGEVRALLCGSCNLGLGKFGDDPERLVRAAAYLDNHSGGSKRSI